jgi:hypothetical protein
MAGLGGKYGVRSGEYVGELGFQANKWQNSSCKTRRLDSWSRLETKNWKQESASDPVTAVGTNHERHPAYRR